MQFYYICSECGKRYDITPERMLCDDCRKYQEAQKPLRGILDVDFQGMMPSKNFSIYDFLPVEKEFFPPIPVGNTPIWKIDLFGFPNLFIKDDSLNPSGSLKDRASYLVAAAAKKFGLNRIVVASTGNAASSMSAVAASAGIEAIIFVPSAAPRAKLIQILQYGATLILVDGNYDDAYDLSMEYVEKFGGYSRNTAYNPLTIDGKKTAALEIFQQLGEIDRIYVPVGDGVILGGVFQGFKHLIKAGLMEKMPKVMAVQSEKSNCIKSAFDKGEFVLSTAASIADSINVDVPRNGYFALKCLKEYDGEVVQVCDDDILSAQHIVAKNTGHFCEPAAAAGFAGFISTKDRLNPNEKIVILSTGNGLKDIQAAEKGIQFPKVVFSDVARVKNYIDST